MQKYKPESLMTDEEIKLMKQSLEADLYVNTNKKGGMKTIEIFGVEQSYESGEPMSPTVEILLLKT